MPPPPPPSPTRPADASAAARAVRRRAGFARDPDDRVVGGVCAGLAARLGVDALLLRLATVVLALAGGVGVLLYLVAWLLADDEPLRPPRAVTTQQNVAVGLVVLGVLLLLRDLDLWLGDGVVLPVLLGAVGSVVLWSRGDADDHERWTRLGGRIPGNPVQVLLADRSARVRLLVGAGLVAVGVTAFLATSEAVVALRQVGAAVLATLAGATLVLGPWVSRLVSELGEERAERVRTEERAEVAAHLHDSVLQTLALIQRAGTDPRRMAQLARSQERELRAWLYGRHEPAEATTLRALLHQAVAEVEADHDLVVDLVVVGDHPAGGDVGALVAAVREALVNVARHAGVDHAACYVEVEPGAATAFVRDRGSGFDADAVPDDRRGVADSVRGRLARHGGRATLRTAPGTGTEWELVLPLEAPDTQEQR